MRTILIVDDDRTIREGLALMLRDIESQVNVLMAGTGADALEVAMHSAIDLILTDVKMPVMDGLELMENLRQLDFSGEVVIISGFDEFDFVRKAMKLGAADYLLKPVKSQALETVYAECIKRLYEKKQSALLLTPHVASDNPHVQQARLSGLLADGGVPADNLLIELPSQMFCLVADTFSTERVLAQTLRKAFNTVSSQGYDSTLLQGEYLGLWTVLCFMPAEKGYYLCEALQEALQRSGLHCGISGIYSREESRSAFLEAQSALAACFYDETPSEGCLKETYPYPDHSARLIACVATGDWMECGKALRELFIQILFDQPEADALRRYLSDFVYSLMNQDKDLISIIGKYKLTDKDIMLKVREAQTFSQLRKEYQEIILLYLSEMKDRRLSQDDNNIHQAKVYIENNFGDNVSLGEIAHRLDLHPNYFSTLFRQKTGETFSDYLRSVRIAKAIELMNATNMKVYEIACKVGYNDNAQFYRAFKQITGISPGQYKQKHI